MTPPAAAAAAVELRQPAGLRAAIPEDESNGLTCLSSTPAF